MVPNKTEAERRSAELTKLSGSNLARTFFLLPPEKRRRMQVFYAFCRLVDDIADEDSLPSEHRRDELERWRMALQKEVAGEHWLAGEVRNLMDDAGIAPAILEDIVDGVLMDVPPQSYETWKELEQYCLRVASAVGLASVRIFGCRDSSADQYAVNLGLALQITNIIRDVWEDRNRDGRIYLPREEMVAFDVKPEDFDQFTPSPAVQGLLRRQAERAEEYFDLAKAAYPKEHAWALRPAELMAGVYRGLLTKMLKHNFAHWNVRQKPCRLACLQAIVKVWITGRY